jgi:hypothetical protein
VILALVVCLELLAPPAPLVVTAVKHMEDGTISSTDAQCSRCSCWLPPPGCALNSCADACGYNELSGCPSCILWGPFTTSDAFGCVDLELLPTPAEGWVYWVKEP